MPQQIINHGKELKFIIHSKTSVDYMRNVCCVMAGKLLIFIFHLETNEVHDA